jgi:hypothetical protein
MAGQACQKESREEKERRDAVSVAKALFCFVLKNLE